MSQEEAEITEKKTAWTTWEELLLACAVKRHGLSDWDAVSMEIQSRTTSLPHIFTTPHHCKLKYFDLRRRFKRRDVVDDDEEAVADYDADAVPWLEELKNLRVAELRHEVHRYDASILSLQLKVKRLEEDCERGFTPNVAGNEKPDLENNVTKKDRSENDKNDSPESPAGKLHSDEESDRGNQSANESNSAGPKREIRNTGSDKVHEPAESEKPDPVRRNSKSGGEVESCNESSGSIAKGLGSKKTERESSELRDSLSESKISVKSQPLIGVLDLIRSHTRGSLFDRRLQSQENDRYNDLILQHMDLQTMQKQLNQGFYSSCTSKFYRDLLLIINNAIVFFPKSSVESITATELRNLVSNEMSKQTQRSYSSQEPSVSPPIQLQPKPESLLTKHKSSAHIIVCRKRSSISSKAASAAVISSRKDELQQSEEKKPVIDSAKSPTDSVQEQSLITPDTKDRIVTGFRSLRRSNTIPPPKTEKTKKEKEIPASTKKRGAADFLKRIKENSPLDKLKSSPNEPKNTRQNNGGDKRKHIVEKNDGRKDRIVLRSKQETKEEISPSKRNVGRPSKKAADPVPVKRRREAEVSTSSKRPKKR